MATQQENSANVLASVGAIITKYGIKAINDDFHDPDHHVCRMSRDFGDLRSTMTFEKNEAGEFTAFTLNLSDNLKITNDIKRTFGYDADYRECIGDEDDMYSFIHFRVHNVESDIRFAQRHVEALEVQNKRWVPSKEREALKQQLAQAKAKHAKLLRVRSKRTVTVHAPQSKQTFKLTPRTFNKLFNDLIKLSKANMRDWDSAIANSTAFIKHAVSH